MPFLQIAPFTQDVVHLIFACCGSDMMTDWTEIISDYYDYLKVAIIIITSISDYYDFLNVATTTDPILLGLSQGYLSTHALDSNNLGLNFDKFMGAVAKVGTSLETLHQGWPISDQFA